MCLIVFNWSPGTPQWITLSANRDEFWQRPTSPLSDWQNETGIMAGQDQEQGGTWAGINRYGQFSLLTNVRAPGAGPENPQSRGHLVRDFLQQITTPEEFARKLAQQCHQYAPFNILLGNHQQLIWQTNYPTPGWQAVKPGIHALSNAALDTPWPKSSLAQQQLKEWLQNGHKDPQQLADLLSSRATFADEELPQTGVPHEWEKMLSAQLIVSPAYGTRSSSSLIGRDKTLTMSELARTPDGQIADQRTESVQLP